MNVKKNKKRELARGEFTGEKVFPSISSIVMMRRDEESKKCSLFIIPAMSHEIEFVIAAEVHRNVLVVKCRKCVLLN